MDWEDFLGILSVILIVIFALGLAWYIIVLPILGYTNPETIEGVVKNSYIKRYLENDYFHHVVEFDDGHQEVFQNRDAFWIGKWNSADLELSIKGEQRYAFEVRGIRWPFFSKFRNIISVTALDKP